MSAKKGLVNLEEIILDKTKVLNEIKKEVNKFDELQNLLSKDRRIMLEIKKQSSDCIVGQNLINCDPINNHDVILSLSKCILDVEKIPLIILTSTNYKSIIDLFEESKLSVENIFIIDTVSKNISSVIESDQFFFVDSLRNLTQLQIKLFKIISKNKDVIFIFDSINVLELYHSEKIIFKFIYSLTKLMHKYKISGYYIVNKKSLVQKIGQFCDNIIKIDKME